MIFCKWLGFLVVVLLLSQVVRAGIAGRALSRSTDDEEELLLSQHRSALKRSGLLIVVAVVIVELLVRMSPVPYATPTLLAFHLSCVAAFVLLIALIVFKYTGLANPVMHRRLVYPAFIALALIVLSGGIQLALLPVG